MPAMGNDSMSASEGRGSRSTSTLGANQASIGHTIQQRHGASLDHESPQKRKRRPALPDRKIKGAGASPARDRIATRNVVGRRGASYLER